MKLSYRDRIILIFAIVIVILGIGIFVFIKPKYEKMKKNKADLKAAQDDWNTKLLEFDRIPVRQGVINDTYAEGLKISEGFTNEMTSVEVDEFLQQFFNTEQFVTDEVSAKKDMSVSNEKSTTLGYYYYTPNIVTYPLYEAADLDGSIAKAVEEKLHDVRVLSARKAQTVSDGEEKFTVLLKRENLMSFLDELEKYAREHSDAMLITSVKLDDCNFNEDLEDGTGAQAGQVDADGNPVQVAAPKNDNNKADVKKDYTEATIEYKAYYIQEPTKPDVGPAYDKTIWDGNDWRTAVAE